MESFIMRKAIAAGLFVAVLLLAVIWGCGGGGSSSGGSDNSSGSTTRNVATTGNASSPTGFSFESPVTVKSGTIVKWVNQSSAPHSVVWDAQTPSSAAAPGAGIGTFGAGATSDAWVAPTVSANTTYAYHCGIHGPMMSGDIVVTP
jgi:plastocyanin